MPYDFGEGIGGSRRIREQMGDLFNPEDPTPTYDTGLSHAFQVPRITSQDYSNYGSSEDDSYSAGLKSLYGSARPSMDAYRSYLSKSPQAADYTPTKWDRVAAGLSGLAAGIKDPGQGIAVAQKMNRSRYDTALSDYYQQAKPLGEAAKLESDDRDDMLKYYMQAGALDNTRSKNQHDWLASQATANWHNKTADETVRYHNWQIDSGNKHLTNETNNINSLDAYRRGTLAQGGQRIGIERENANTNAGRLGVERFNSQRPHYEAPPTAGEIDTAEQSAMSDLAPTHPNLVKADTNRRGSYVLMPPPDVGTKEYFQYQRDLKVLQDEATRRAHGSLSLTGGGGGPYTAMPNEDEE